MFVMDKNRSRLKYEKGRGKETILNEHILFTSTIQQR